MQRDVQTTSSNVLKQAVTKGATDIHFVPKEEKVSIFFRVRQDMIQIDELHPVFYEKVVSHFKFLARMDIGEKRRPQNGSFQTKLLQKPYYLRLSTLPSAYQESLVIRLHPQTSTLSLNQLSLFPQSNLTFTNFIKRSSGLIIISGPTGSGKTTTIYSLLEEAIRFTPRSVITIEDPVEKKNDKFIQVQINEAAGITFTTALRAALRHDPDILMIGEIRDSETAKTAVRAAMTGHLVFTSLHTKDATGALYRLKEFGVPLDELEQTVMITSSQRLVDLYCPYCNGKCQLDCPWGKHNKQVSVSEMLYGKTLKEVFKAMRGEGINYHYKTLKDVIKKGVALGFVTRESYDRWIGDET